MSSNPLTNNTQSPMLISSQLLNKRKLSFESNANKNNQNQNLKKFKSNQKQKQRQVQIQMQQISVSDLDLSIIQKKQSQLSQFPLKNSINQHLLLSPQTHPQLPIFKQFHNPNPYQNNPPPTATSKLKQTQQNRHKSSPPIQNKTNQDKKQNKKTNKLKNKFTEQPQQNQQQQQFTSKQIIVQSINWHEIWLFVKLCLFSYQFNIIDYLKDIDQKTLQKVIDLLQISPGYKPIQYIYTFYMLKYGLFVGILTALLYPLTYSIMFLMITVDIEIPFIAIFMLAGMRSGAIALLLKYCLHFPKHTFHWIVLIFTVLIGIFMPNNYIFILLFAISIFLSFYLHTPQQNISQSQLQPQPQLNKQQSQQSPQQLQSQNNLQLSQFGLNTKINQQQIYKYYKIIDNLPQTYANLSISILVIALFLLWILQRYFSDRQLVIFGQIIPISLLMSSKQMLAFFPYIYNQTVGISTLQSNTLIALSFLFPGPHSKVFMFFIVHSQIKNVIIAYLCLYLPPILLVNIFITYRPYFYTRTYYNIRQSIQAVGNGIVFCLVIKMLEKQQCFFNSICYSAVVIVVVAKLYKLRELFAIVIGIFLISTRTIILNTNKGISFQEQACINNGTNFTTTSY